MNYTFNSKVRKKQKIGIYRLKINKLLIIFTTKYKITKVFKERYMGLYKPIVKLFALVRSSRNTYLMKCQLSLAVKEEKIVLEEMKL